jgi:hypothetical protein
MYDDGQSPGGSHRGNTPVKRRPLPSNPGSVDQQRALASGPREFGTPSQPRSAEITPGGRRKSAYNNNMPQPIQQRRQSRQPQLQYHAPEEQDPFVQHNGFDNHHDPYGYEGHNGSDVGSDWHQPNGHHDSGSYGPPQHQQNYQDPADFLPQLPPMNRSRDGNSGRSSRMQQEYDNSLRHSSQEDTRSTSATSVSDYHSDSRNGWNQQPAELMDSYQHNGGDPWSQQYEAPLSRTESQEEYQYQSNGYHQDQNNFPGGHEIEYQQQEQFSEPMDLPPPPPMHRALPSTELTRSFRSSTGNEFNEPTWSQEPDTRGGLYSPQPRSLTHLTSRSEVSLAKYNETFDEGPDMNYSRSANGSFGGHQDDMALQRHRGFSEEPMQTYRSYDQPSPQSPYFNTSQSSPIRKEVPHTPRSAGSFSNEAYGDSTNDRRDSYQSMTLPEAHPRSARYQPHHSQTYPPPVQHSPLGSSSQYSLQHSRNGSVTPNMSPTRPHPLSQEHNLMSSSPHEYPREDRAIHSSSYDPSMPLIKPLAIAPRKSQPSTPSSVDRHGRSQSRSTIPRKSVSPHPASVDGKAQFSAYSPESFNVLNPTSSPTANRKTEPIGPIVDFHGNVIDPSDRLPEHSWAPEPTTTAKLRSDDHLPASSWAPEPDRSRHRNSEPRRITVRTRDAVRGARGSGPSSPSVSVNVSCNARPPPEHRSSMFVSTPSPLESPIAASPTSTPHVRNRLRKMNRPQSMAAMSTSAPTDHSQRGWTPPIPAKVPLDDGRSIVPYGSNMDRFNYEMQNIDIGGSEPRRIGGRRLLGFGG